jgi:hemerythrin-like metal-binding protein
MLLMWTDNLSVNIKDFDDDHKRVIRIINELHGAIQGAAATGKIAAAEMEIALHRLDNYVQRHCAQEELFMTQTGYSELEEHKKEHAKLAALIGDIQSRLRGSTDPKDAAELMQFVYDKVIDHIFVTDRKYSSYLHSKGIF